MLFELFITFFKIGLFTFGGGYAMIPLIKEEVVEKKKWITSDEMLEIIAIAETTPGPIAINMATFIGYRNKKVLGSLLATLGVILPSMIVIILLSLIYDAFMENIYVQYAFVGIKCAVAILILKSGIQMIIKADKKILFIILLILTIIAMICIEVFSLSFSSIFIILIGGIIGIISGSIKKAGAQE
ncbi:MAG: chromate transporter [Bacilli bacterium]|nr:chromate transporter [Bacilli bacterium]